MLSILIILIGSRDPATHPPNFSEQTLSSVPRGHSEEQSRDMSFGVGNAKPAQMGQAFSSSLFEDIGFNFRYKIIRGFDYSISLIIEIKRGFKK